MVDTNFRCFEKDRVVELKVRIRVCIWIGSELNE